MYPYILLRIEEYIPKIFLVSLENDTKEVESSEEIDLLDIVLSIGEKLNLIKPPLNSLSETEKYDYLISLARGSDEAYVQLEMDVWEEFSIVEYIDNFLNNNKIQPVYLDVELNDDIKNEIDQNQNSDLLASILEHIYTIIIARTILVASEMGIGVIHLSDNSKNARLQEKMALELQKIDIELIID